jgi:hypothetical protein
MNEELDRHLPGVDWNFSQYLRDNVMESLSGVKGDNYASLAWPVTKLATPNHFAIPFFGTPKPRHPRAGCPAFS